MKNWGDAKRWIFQDIVECIVILVIDVLYDALANLLIVIGINQGNGLLHPYHIGTYQLLVLAVVSMKLIQCLNRWKYYK